MILRLFKRHRRGKGFIISSVPRNSTSVGAVVRRFRERVFWYSFRGISALNRGYAGIGSTSQINGRFFGIPHRGIRCGHGRAVAGETEGHGTAV